MKTTEVYGIKMSALEELIFSKYIATNGIAMNTKTKEERLIIASNWLDTQPNRQSN